MSEIFHRLLSVYCIYLCIICDDSVTLSNLQAHQRRFCPYSRQWKPGTGPGAGNWWSCRCRTCPAARWTDPGGWWAGCGRLTGPQSRYEEQSPHADSLWTCASPDREGRKGEEEDTYSRSAKGGQTQRGIKKKATTTTFLAVIQYLWQSSRSASFINIWLRHFYNVLDAR